MIWEFWFTIVIALILIGTIILIGNIVWVFVGIKKKENPVRLSNYLFAYRIKEGDPKGLPTEFLVNWKISNLENHLYLLYLTLEEDLYMEGYLHSIWVDYNGGYDIYMDVYKVEEDIKHTLIGKFCMVEGRICYTPV